MQGDTKEKTHTDENMFVFHTDERERSVRDVHTPYPTVVMVVTAQYMDAMYCESIGESMMVFFPIIKDINLDVSMVVNSN